METKTFQNNPKKFPIHPVISFLEIHLQSYKPNFHFPVFKAVEQFLENNLILINALTRYEGRLARGDRFTQERPNFVYYDLRNG